MVDVRELGELQLDGLREVASIGAGHAATALSQLTHKVIMVDVPRLAIVALEDVPRVIEQEEAPVAAVMMQVLGDLTGRTVQVFPARTASRLAGILLQEVDVDFPDGFGEMEQSALKECGNILSGAYLGALSDFLGMVLLTSVPALAVDMSAAVLSSAYLGDGEVDDHLLCIDTIFRMDGDEAVLRGHFLLLPDAPSLRIILRSIRLG
jgi:chemotaxis protein CheC